MKRLGVVAFALLVIGSIAWFMQWRLSAPLSSADIQPFLDAHWQRPLAPQGQPPADFSAREASLAPSSCGTCHQTQWRDWQTSLHAQTMQAGVLWQLHLLPPAESNQCLDCHAPLAEQKALIARELQWPNAPQTPPPAYVPNSLAHDGLVCAACHVRRHERFGPPATTRVGQARAHHGFTATGAFADSRFCASCHQFPDTGPRINGKLHEDTLAQWQASAFASQGTSCQACHMPGRRHLWRGIHDPEMVRSALSSRLQRRTDTLIATVTNTGAGHFFPTYLVPEVRVQLWLLDGKREQLLTEHVIAWRVNLDLDKEAFDTRLKPGESLTLTAALPAKSSPDAKVELRLEVLPDAHYQRSFAYVLEQRDKLDAATLELLQAAIREKQASRFTLTLAEQPLTHLAP